MRTAVLYVAAALCLVLIVSTAWWTREFLPGDAATRSLSYVAQPGDTQVDVAEILKVDVADLATINNLELGAPLQPGQRLQVPDEGGLSDIWGVHIFGLLAELAGVLLSFWLAAMVGMLPKRVRKQVLGISMVLGLVSYSATQSVAAANPTLTPQFIFGALKDGFFWAAAFPMLARMIGIKEIEAIPERETEAETATPAPEAPAVAESEAESKSDTE